MATDIHDYARTLELALRKAEVNPAFSTRTKENIRRFKDECFMQGITAGRVARYIFDVRRLLEWSGKDLEHATLADVKALVSRIEQSSYAPSTRRDLKITLRKYVLFLDGGTEPPKTVAWIKSSAGVKTLRIPEVLLSEEDIRRMLETAESLRDKAFISTLYESGCRVGEVLGLRIKHVAAAKVGMVLRVDGKTGPRRMRVISSAPSLSELINHHPRSRDPDAFLWCTRLESRLTYAAANALLKRAARRAGIITKIYPHLFRHSRATHLANHLTEAQMKEYFGWIQGSKMAGVYVHMSGRDVDNAILRLHGLEPEEPKRGTVLDPQPCARCKASNPAGHRFCMICGMPLSREAEVQALQVEEDRKEADTLLDKLIEDPEVQDLLRRKLRGLKT